MLPPLAERQIGRLPVLTGLAGSAAGLLVSGCEGPISSEPQPEKGFKFYRSTRHNYEIMIPQNWSVHPANQWINIDTFKGLMTGKTVTTVTVFPTDVDSRLTPEEYTLQKMDKHQRDRKSRLTKEQYDRTLKNMKEVSEEIGPKVAGKRAPLYIDDTFEEEIHTSSVFFLTSPGKAWEITFSEHRGSQEIGLPKSAFSSNPEYSWNVFLYKILPSFRLVK